jgi:cation:H+ antiporter
MEKYPVYLLSILFLTAAVITWLAGIILTKTTSTFDSRFKLGDAIGGLIFLGISGSLPEIAICLSAAHDGRLEVITGNLLGGLAIQTLILVIFDFVIKRKKPLAYLAGSRNLSLETFFPVVLTTLALMGTWISVEKNIFNVNPFSVVVALAWIGGIWIIGKTRNVKVLNETAEEAIPGRFENDRRKNENHAFYAKKSTWYVAGIFLAACVVTLISGVILEKTGSAIADHFGIGEGLFAATVIALVSSLPEISTGLESVFINDNHLAVSDVMGGNAFMLIIFFLADVVSGQPVLSYAGRTDILFAVLGIAMMLIYSVSFLVAPKRKFLRLGIDSIMVLVVYVLGVIGIGILK